MDKKNKNKLTTKDELTEFLLYTTSNGEVKIEVFFNNETVWLTQKAIAELFEVQRPAITKHLNNVFKEGELKENSVSSILEHTALDNKKYNTKFYNLDAIISVGYRVNSRKATQFRIWATKILKEFVVKGFAMDDERLKNPKGRYDYFDELLNRIRDIRASEKRFYQKVRDLFKLSRDYDKTDKETQIFFAETQNKILYAITGKTAAEIVVSRASANKKNMALTSWKGSIVRKEDIYIAKNYLTKDEIDSLNRFVVVFLETAELRAKDRQYITIKFWKENIDRIIEFNDKKLLIHKGKISNDTMKKYASDIYEKFNNNRKRTEAKLEDKEDLKELEQLEKRIKNEQ